MVCVTTPLFSIVVGYGHLQHGGAGWGGMYFLRYHAYFIPSPICLKDAFTFAYGTPSSIRPSATQLSDDEDMLAPVDIPEKL